MKSFITSEPGLLFHFSFLLYKQGSYASGKCQGNLKNFKVRELSGNFMLCQGKMNVF